MSEFNNMLLRICVDALPTDGKPRKIPVSFGADLINTFSVDTGIRSRIARLIEHLAKEVQAEDSPYQEYRAQLTILLSAALIAILGGDGKGFSRAMSLLEPFDYPHLTDGLRALLLDQIKTGS